jgi:hypothetical protein
MATQEKNAPKSPRMEDSTFGTTGDIPLTPTNKEASKIHAMLCLYVTGGEKKRGTKLWEMLESLGIRTPADWGWINVEPLEG